MDVESIRGRFGIVLGSLRVDYGFDFEQNVNRIWALGAFWESLGRLWAGPGQPWGRHGR